jgi:hypothetical protein
VTYLEKVMSRCVEIGNCLVWTGALNSDGYPRAGIDGNSNIKLHRYVCSHYHNIEGKVVRHTCDNPVCLNPEHLVPGEVVDNIRDMDERGRRYRTLTDVKANTIMNLLKLGFDVIQIEGMTGVNRRRIYELRSGKRTPDGRLAKP